MTLNAQHENLKNSTLPVLVTCRAGVWLSGSDVWFLVLGKRVDKLIGRSEEKKQGSLVSEQFGWKKLEQVNGDRMVCDCCFLFRWWG